MNPAVIGLANDKKPAPLIRTCVARMVKVSLAFSEFALARVAETGVRRAARGNLGIQYVSQMHRGVGK